MADKQVGRVQKYVNAIKGAQFVVGFVLGVCLMFFGGKNFLAWSTAAPLVNFQNLELESMQGDTLAFNEAGEGYRLVYFWASWHKRCAKDLPKLAAACEALKAEDCNCIAISDENQQVIEPFYASYKQSMTFFRSAEALRELGLKGIPSYYLLSPQNEILDSKTGIAHWEKTSQLQKIKDLLQ